MPPDEIRFYVDPSTGLPHLYKHDVTEEEVEEVLANADDDRGGRGGTREAIGLTREGRCILVAYRRNGGIFVITAYELKGQALIAFRRRRRRRWHKR